MKNIIILWIIMLFCSYSLTGQKGVATINMSGTPVGIYADFNNIDFGSKGYVVLRKESQQTEHEVVLQHLPLRTAKELSMSINKHLFYVPGSTIMSDTIINNLWKYWRDPVSHPEFVQIPSPLIKLSFGLAFLDTSVELGKSYDYIIENVDGDRYSGTIVYRLDTVEFAAIRNIEINPGEGFPELRFRSLLNNSSPNFDLYRKVSGSFAEFEITHTTKGMILNETRDSVIYFIQDTTALKSVRYDYFIRGKDMMGNPGIASDTVYLQVGGNRNVRSGFNLRTGAVDRGIAIKWEPLSQRYSLQTVLIYKSANYDTGYELLATLPVTDTIYYDYNVVGGVNYYYQLVVQGESNMSIATPKVSGLYNGIVNLVAPIAVQGEIVNGKPLLSWLHQDTVNVEGFYVYRAIGRNGEMLQVSETIPFRQDSLNTFLDTTVTETGEVAFYGITAISKTQSLSPMSEIIAISIPESTDHKIEAPDQLRAIWHNQNTVSITWRDMDRYEGNVSHYNIYRKKVENETFPDVPVAIVHYNEFLDTLLALEVYDYAIQTVSNYGNVSPLSVSVNVAQIPDKLLPPIVFSVLESNGIAYLNWSEGGSNIDKFNIYRVINDETPILYRTLNGNQNSMEDSNITKGNHYFYYISCVNKDGVESNWSEEKILIY